MSGFIVFLWTMIFLYRLTMGTLGDHNIVFRITIATDICIYLFFIFIQLVFSKKLFKRLDQTTKRNMPGGA